MLRLAPIAFATATACLACGCVDAPDAGPRPISPLPRIHRNEGRVLQRPHIVVLSFTNSRFADKAVALAKALEGSAYWTRTTAEYGVGPLGSTTSIALDEPAPPLLDTDTTNAWLNDKIANDGRFSAVDEDAIVTFLYPPITEVSVGESGLCTTNGGFHSFLSVGDFSIPFAIIGDCTPAGDDATSTCSHEWIEAATDPFISGYIDVDDEFYEWDHVAFGSEVADLCNLAGATRVADTWVSRAWSNEAAAAGLDPCVPAPRPDYRGARPVVGDDFETQRPHGATVTTKGVQLVDGWADIELVFFGSPESQAPITIFLTSLYPDTGGPYVAFSKGVVTGLPGDRVEVRVNRLRPLPNAVIDFSVFVEISPTSLEPTWWGLIHE